MVQSVSAERARELIDSGEIELVDVRELNEWLTGHIDSARHVPLSRLRNNAKASLPRDKVIFVCAAGSRSNMAAQLALATGLKEVYNLSGGTRAWVAAGFALVHSASQATG
ncbi:MAG TPA: rhodanese-like domain-containing protein [Polyangiales bacterium]|jgi:rhodanese-related sulfurtransferase